MKLLGEWLLSWSLGYAGLFCWRASFKATSKGLGAISPGPWWACSPCFSCGTPSTCLRARDGDATTAASRSRCSTSASSVQHAGRIGHGQFGRLLL